MLNLPLRHLRPALAAAALALASLPGQAAPDLNSDAMAQLLLDKGVIAPAQTLAHVTAPALGQVRDTTSDLVLSAMNFLGVPYKRGGNSSETGFDCSGFTRYVFENSLGLLLPRRADEQAKFSSLKTVKRTELQPGDLVFFNTMRRTFSHVGIYVGDNKFIHAPRSGGEIRVESLSVKYWAKRFTGARRAPAAEANAASPAGAATAADAPAATPVAATGSGTTNTAPTSQAPNAAADNALTP